MIKVIYNKTCGRCVQSEPLTSGMVGQTIEFEYSADFDGLALTAVFTNGKTTVDVLNPDKQCVIPHEVLGTVGMLVKVGIYATKGNELVIPTVYATIGIVLKGADPSGDASVDPTLPVWAQIKGLIGNLDDLETEAKNNLVAAINEAAQAGGGGSASITMRVEGGYIQYSTDKGETWANLIAVAELKGDKGDAGADGKDGTDGVTPHIGGNGNWYIGDDDTGKPSRGEQGAKGDKGDAGADGKNGIDGVNGKDGADGITPHIGDNGNWFIGNDDTGKPSQGEQGAKGDTGPQGPKGETGPKGPQGEAGPKGDPGEKGDKGDPGTPGKNGTDGHTPVKGTDYWTAADKAEIVEDTKNAIDLSSYAKQQDLNSLKTRVSTLENAGYLTLDTLPKYEGETE